MKTQTALEIAALCRNTCEAFQQHTLLYPNNLGGMCAIASHFLFRKLSENSFRPTFVKGQVTLDNWGRPTDHKWHHCWITIGNYNIDITATQFASHKIGDYPPILTFFGKAENHPALSRQAPNIDRGYTDKGINAILHNWSNTETLNRDIARRLEKFYAR